MKKIFFIFLLLQSLTNQALADGKEFLIQIKDHKFIPATINVPAGEKFKLIVENLDETAEEFESADLRKEKIVGGGKKISLIIAPLKAGEYQFFGEFHAKTAQGKLVVR